LTLQTTVARQDTRLTAVLIEVALVNFLLNKCMMTMNMGKIPHQLHAFRCSPVTIPACLWPV